MTNTNANSEAQPVKLKSKFGEDADLYAEVRADAACASGRPEAAQEWQQAASELRDEEQTNDRNE